MTRSTQLAVFYGRECGSTSTLLASPRFRPRLDNGDPKIWGNATTVGRVICFDQMSSPPLERISQDPERCRETPRVYAASASRFARLREGAMLQ